jgi:hypothetical protein
VNSVLIKGYSRLVRSPSKTMIDHVQEHKVPNVGKMAILIVKSYDRKTMHVSVFNDFSASGGQSQLITWVHPHAIIS